MKTYILKLKTTSTTNYNLYDGTTLVSDSDLATLFGSAGSAYFAFDFNEGTPTNTTSLTILNSQDTAVMTNTGLEGIAEDRNFKGVWADSATAFTSFTLLKGVAMDEAELTTLVGMVKNAGGIKTLTTADYNYPTSNPTSVALWLLPVGAYKIPNGVSAMAAVGNPVSSGKDAIAYVNTKTSNRVEITTDIAGYGWATEATTPAGGLIEVTIIYGVLDNLTSSSRKQPLSANQGRVLKGLINALDTPFTGTDGTVAGTKGLVPAPATTDAGKFLKADGTWAEAGGGGVKTLTSADYNWNFNTHSTTNPNSIALWLLPEGFYKVAQGSPDPRIWSYRYGGYSSEYWAEDGYWYVSREYQGQDTTKALVFFGETSVQLQQSVERIGKVILVNVSTGEYIDSSISPDELDVNTDYIGVLATLDDLKYCAKDENYTTSTALAAGAKGLVPAPGVGTKKKVLTDSAGWDLRQSDYEQNDNTMGDYVKNRPFYEYTTTSSQSLIDNTGFSHGGGVAPIDSSEYPPSAIMDDLTNRGISFGSYEPGAFWWSVSSATKQNILDAIDNGDDVVFSHIGGNWEDWEHEASGTVDLTFEVSSATELSNGEYAFDGTLKNGGTTISGAVVYLTDSSNWGRDFEDQTQGWNPYYGDLLAIFAQNLSWNVGYGSSTLPNIDNPWEWHIDSDSEVTVTKKLDNKYLKVDGDTISVNSDGELEAQVSGGDSSNLFWGVIGTTTGTEVQQALTDGKKVYFIGTTANYPSIIIPKTQPSVGDTSVSCVAFEYNSSSPEAFEMATCSVSNLASSSALAAGSFNAGHKLYFANSTGTAQSYGMSQNAVTNMVYNDGDTKKRIRLGDSASAGANDTVALGRSADAGGTGAIAIGTFSYAHGDYSVALGRSATATVQGQFDIGAGTSGVGYNSSNYRLLTGLYDPQSAHDAATKGYIDSSLQSTLINGGTTVPTSSTEGQVGTQYNCVNNGEPEIYICTAVDTSTTPNTYTWKKVGLTLQLSTTDPGEGSQLADNTLLGIYE